MTIDTRHEAFRRDAECPHSKGWTLEELSALLESYESGADVEVLATNFSTQIKDIWHRLSWLYFGESCPHAGPVGKNHGKRWDLTENSQLKTLYNEGVPVTQIAVQLGRSPHAVCVRLLEKWWAQVPRPTIEMLGLKLEDF